MANKNTPTLVVDDSGDLIEAAMMHLVFNEPFFANLLMNMKRIYTVDIPTLGVNVTDSINLHVNPYFWKNLELKEQIDVLKHECYHVINNHFVRFRDIDPKLFNNLEKKTYEKGDSKKDVVDKIIGKINGMTEFRTLNQAADYAINEYLPNLPKKMKFFDKKGNMVVEPAEIPDGKGGTKKNKNAGKPIIGEPCLVNLLKKQYKEVMNEKNMEYYYEFLQNKKNEGKGGQSPGDGTRVVVIDDHGLWSEGDQDEEFVTEKVRGIVNKAAEQTMNDRSAGSIPGDILLMIEKLNHKPRNWKQDLRRFVARTSNCTIESTRKKRNRRYGIMHPGYKVYPTLTLALLYDCSGSVNDEELTQFIAEMHAIGRCSVNILAIEFDASVNNVYKFDPKKKIEIRGRGGTHFAPAFEEAKKHEVDGIICFTDGGDCYSDCKKPKIPVLWALTGENAAEHLPYKWGSRTKIEVRKRRK